MANTGLTEPVLPARGQWHSICGGSFKFATSRTLQTAEPSHSMSSFGRFSLVRKASERQAKQWMVHQSCSVRYVCTTAGFESLADTYSKKALQFIHDETVLLYYAILSCRGRDFSLGGPLGVAIMAAMSTLHPFQHVKRISSVVCCEPLCHLPVHHSPTDTLNSCHHCHCLF